MLEEDDPLEFEVDREGLRQYLASVTILATSLPGLVLVFQISAVLAESGFRQNRLFPFFVFSGILGAGLVYGLVRLARSIAPNWAWSLRYWIDPGKNLRVEHGLFLRRSLAIPLDRIEQIVICQNPLMRRFGVWNLHVQTAGSRMQGSTNLLGLKAPEKVRDILLDERRKALREVQAEHCG